MGVERENIRGKDVSNLIERIQEDRTLINMQLMENGQELLTLIDDIRSAKNGLLFAVDMSEDLKNSGSADFLALKFQFLDANKVPCEFIASSVEISDNRIWVMFPEVIYREQKREHFRIEAPLGARVSFRKGDATFRMNVSNISMGGLLVTIRVRATDANFLSVGERLQDTELVFSTQIVRIKDAVVAWAEGDVLAPSAHFGIQFTAIDEVERRLLKRVLYELQREFLARRAGTA